MHSNTIDIRLIEALLARVFPCTVPSHVERVEEGVSTYVYRIYRGHELFYLRVLPEVNASFAPEVYVHEMLRAKNVKVPEVVYFEHYNEAVQRSVMVTTRERGYRERSGRSWAGPGGHQQHPCTAIRLDQARQQRSHLAGGGISNL